MANNDSTASGYYLRLLRPGDMGTIISRHGVIYTRDFKWSPKFEADCARVCADFIENFDPAFESCWVAESTTTGDFLGSVALLKHRSESDTAQLRLFLVDPAARGKGLGAHLINECIAFAQVKSYAKLVLWTFSCLDGARRLYERAGFELVQSSLEEKEMHGVKLVHELWLHPLHQDQKTNGSACN